MFTVFFLDDFGAGITALCTRTFEMLLEALKLLDKET